MAPTVDEVLREFVRYQGDGMGGIGPLPIGDPQSGIYHPTKKDIRDTVGQVFDIRDEVEDIRDYVAGLVSDVVSQATVPHFSTVTAVQGYSIPVGMNVIYITGRTTAGIGGHYYNRRPGSTHPFRFTDGAGAVWEPTTNPAALAALSSAAAGITVGVGATGDYPDIPTAIASLENYSCRPGQKIVLRLVSPITRGYLSSQGRDDSKFLITNGTGGASVPLASGFEGVSDVGLGANERTDNLLAGYYAALPTLGCLINMGNTGGSGYYGIWQCSGLIMMGCGVINAGYNALEWRGGGGVAGYKTVWNGATCSGIRIAHAASGAFQESTANDCCKNPDSGETTGAIDVSRLSTLHFRGGQAMRSGAAAVNLRRASRLVAEESDFSYGAAYGLILQHASNASIWGITVKNTGKTATSGGYGVWARDAYVTLQGATVTGSAGVADIRLGDSSPDHSGAMVNVSNVTTTHGINALQDYMGIDRFNHPSRYGVAWNAAVDEPMAIGAFSATGLSRGVDCNPEFNFLRVSSNSNDASTLFAAYNPSGQAGRLVSQGSTFSLQSTSDARLKRDLGEIDFDPYAWALAVKIRNFEWISDGSRQIGPFAQELYETDPYAVMRGSGDPGDEDFVPWTLDFSKLGPRQHLVIQRLVQDMRQRDQRIAELEGRITAMEAR